MAGPAGAAAVGQVTSAMNWRGVLPLPLVVPAWKREVRSSLICQLASKVA